MDETGDIGSIFSNGLLCNSTGNCRIFHGINPNSNHLSNRGLEKVKNFVPGPKIFRHFLKFSKFSGFPPPDPFRGSGGFFVRKARGYYLFFGFDKFVIFHFVFLKIQLNSGNQTGIPKPN